MNITIQTIQLLASLIALWTNGARRRKPAGYRTMIQSESDAKTVKGTAHGYLTGIMYLAPHKLSGVINTCIMASAGCIASCLFTAGRAAFTPAIRAARIAKTLFLVNNQFAALASMAYDIDSLRRRALTSGYCPKCDETRARGKRNRNRCKVCRGVITALKPAVRINGTSDMPIIARAMAKLFPDVQFYDYTKLPKPYLRTLPNYHLTFSHSETNLSDCLDALKHGINVAVVFGLKKSQPLPETWHGYRVISGDETDLRFTDPKGDTGVVIGLYAKGQAKKDCTCFVVRDNAPAGALIQIAA